MRLVASFLWDLTVAGSIAFASAILLLFISTLMSALALAGEAEAKARLRETTVHLSVGTGFIGEGASGKHYIITNDHVCRPARWKGTLTAHYEDGRMLTGTLIREDAVKDLCAAQAPKHTLALRLAYQVLPESVVYSRGYPEHILTESAGKLGEYAEWVYEAPIEEIGECVKGSRPIRSPDGMLRACRFTFVSQLSSLFSRPGSSGSPVVDSNGDLVGVISSWHTGASYEAGLVTYSHVKEFLQSL